MQECINVVLSAAAIATAGSFPAPSVLICVSVPAAFAAAFLYVTNNRGSQYICIVFSEYRIRSVSGSANTEPPYT